MPVPIQDLCLEANKSESIAHSPASISLKITRRELPDIFIPDHSFRSSGPYPRISLLVIYIHKFDLMVSHFTFFTIQREIFHKHHGYFISQQTKIRQFAHKKETKVR